MKLTTEATCCCRRLSQMHENCPLSILVPMDGAVRVSSIVQAATEGQAPSEAPAWKPVLLLIPARFGLDKLTDKYVPNLKLLYRVPQFLGIAGGRPGRSLYFVACQGNQTVSFLLAIDKCLDTSVDVNLKLFARHRRRAVLLRSTLCQAACDT